MQRTQQRSALFFRSLLAAGMFWFATGGGAAAHRAAPQYTEKTLHAFCAWKNCKDGIGPFALVRDRSGNLYGATDYGYPVVFKHDPSTGKYTVIYRFGSGYGYPGDPIVDVSGNLYGTMANGGAHGDGVVYELAYNGSSWTYSALYAFGGGAGGGGPLGLTYAGQSTGSPWDGSSPLFGIAQTGGSTGNGVVYKLTRSGSSWQELAIHDFTAGSEPNALTMDAAGNLFGTAYSGGKYGQGLMYKLAAGSWTQSVLWNFCHSQGCPDGANPSGRLLVDSAGNVFGTTAYGGNEQAWCQGQCGVAFERPASGGYLVIHNFGSGVDGYRPNGSLIMDSSGNLLGTTPSGGATAAGMVFELANGGGSWSESALYTFCSKANCADGSAPLGTVFQDAAGHIYGIAYAGGYGKHCNPTGSGCGALFRLTP